MRSAKTTTFALSAVFIMAGSAFTANSLAAVDYASDIQQGKKIAFSRSKGNCLACHAIAGGKLPGNIGPPLHGIKKRYPKKNRLRAQIVDATVNNPFTIMPPFGKHGVLTEDELDKVVEFIYSL